MIYRVEINWHPEETDWFSESEMEQQIQKMLKRNFVDGYVVDVTIEDEDE